MLEIEILSSGETPRKLNFEQDLVSIGRGLGNDILLEDGEVSRYHARLSIESGAVMIYDLRSRNGTLVNANRVTSSPVSPSDTVQIGGSTIRVRLHNTLLERTHHGPLRTSREEQSLPEPKYRTREQTPTSIITVEEMSNALGEILPEAGRPDAPSLRNLDETREFSLADQTKEHPWRMFENCLAAVLPLTKDLEVESITIDKPEHVVVKRGNQLHKEAVRLSKGQLQEALRIASALAKHTLDESPAVFNVRLSDGCQLSGCLPSFTAEFGALVIRPARKLITTGEELLQRKLLTKELLVALEEALAARKKIIICGEAFSGKSLLLQGISAMIPAGLRISVVQQEHTLQIPQPCVVSLATPALPGRGAARHDALDALAAIEPEFIVLNENISANTAAKLLEISATLGAGCLTMLRAASAAHGLAKLEVDVLRATPGLPTRLAQEQISFGVDMFLETRRKGGQAEAVSLCQVSLKNEKWQLASLL